ncbi:MAG: ATP-binding protein [Thermoanaerobaculia bacterium]
MSVAEVHSKQRRVSGWPRLGLRRELLILLPVAMLILVLLSTFTLLSYRNAIQLLILDRQEEAADTAFRLSVALLEPKISQLALQREAAQADRAALISTDGETLSKIGVFDSDNLLAPLEGRPLESFIGIGPNELLPESIAGFAMLPDAAQQTILRVDLPASELARQQRNLKLLAWIVLPVNFCMGLLVMIFLRHALKPYDILLKQARSLDPSGADEDEVSFLIGTFEKAIAALARLPESDDDDIAALQRTLTPSLESGLLLLDRAGSVLALNEVGSKMLALDIPESGTEFDDLLTGHPELLKLLRNTIEREEGVPRCEITVRTDNREITLGLTIHALRRDDGSVRGYLALFIDLTESRRLAAEEKVADDLAQLGQLAAGLAHELRNSLGTVRGYLTLIERRPEEETIVDYLSEIRRESDHLQRVLEDFLTFARPETRRIEKFDLAQLVYRATVDPGLDAKQIEVSAEELTSPHITGDSQLIEQAIRNLLHNAARADRESGHLEPIQVKLQSRNDGIEIAIKDRGPGLPAEVRERLFQPFVTSRPDGVGLGLSLAHRILTLHGGKLRIEDRQGGGTQAIVWLPIGTLATLGNKSDAGPMPLQKVQKDINVLE